MFITNKSVSNILDTLRCDAQGIFLKPIHALRTYEAFQHLNMVTDLKRVLLHYDEIEQQVLSACAEAKIVRLIFSKHDFSYTYKVLDLDPLPAVLRLQLVTDRHQLSGLGLQNYKWEDRSYWDELLSLKKISALDVISINEKNQIVETSRFNLFFYDIKNDVVITPALCCGCINGVYRRLVFQQGFIQLPGLGKKQIVEKVIQARDINLYQLFAANSVRGVVPAVVVK